MERSIEVYVPSSDYGIVNTVCGRLRTLFGVSAVGLSSASAHPHHSEMTAGSKTPICEGCVGLRLTLATEAAAIKNLEDARAYLLSTCSEGAQRCLRKCQYAPEIFDHLRQMHDDIEKSSGALVQFQEDNMVVVSGQEKSVQAAIQFMDQKGQELTRLAASTKSWSSSDLLCRSSADAGHRETTRTSSGQSSVGDDECLVAQDALGKRRVFESEDSSYDSDYENSEATSPREAEHEEVCRTVSDTLAAEYAEYVTNRSGASAGVSKGLTNLSAVVSDLNYASRVEFALKLGYTEAQVQIALQKLGPHAGQNELLAELIKLGATSKDIAGADDSDDFAVAAPEGSSLEFADDAANLRHIVVDGSNVAMSHGNKECFSSRGIKLCVDWFRARGHQEITVFVPRWRKEASRPDAPIKDQEILLQLEKERLLVFTPSRQVSGRRMACYDDRYILKLAAEVDGIVVSNDNYRDLANENPEFKKVVEERLLMYSFVNDRFMPPDDPLGRHGPSLDNFLRKRPKSSEILPPPCPYGKKCTYGNKCKYYHPERGNQPQKSVTERLAEQAKIQLQEVKARGLKSRDSSPGENLKTLSLPTSASDYGGFQKAGKKLPLSRTKSMLPPMIAKDVTEETQASRDSATKADADKQAIGMVSKEEAGTSFPGQPLLTVTGPAVVASTQAIGPGGGSWPMPMVTAVPTSVVLPSATSWSSVPGLAPTLSGPRSDLLVEPSSGGGHLSVAKRLSDPDNQMKTGIGQYARMQQGPTQGVGSSEDVSNLHRKLQRQLTLNPSNDPRLFQMRGAMGGGAHRLLSPQQEHFNVIHQAAERPLISQRASSQDNIHLMQQGGIHRPVTRLGSEGRMNMPSALPAYLHSWPSATGEHQSVTRISSAPDSYRQWPPAPTSSRMLRLNSTSDTRLNLSPELRQSSPHIHLMPQQPFQGELQVQQAPQHWLLHTNIASHLSSPGSGAWHDVTSGTSSAKGIRQGIHSGTMSQPVRPSSVPPQAMHLSTLSPMSTPRPMSPDVLSEDPRSKLYFHLSSIFPEEQVQAAMDMYPDETNPQKICAAILAMFPKG